MSIIERTVPGLDSLRHSPSTVLSPEAMLCVFQKCDNFMQVFHCIFLFVF